MFLALAFVSFWLSGSGQGLKWNSFDDSAFEKAREERKYVLLHLGANWCHWCHVMEDSTYANKDVQAYLNKHFVVTHEDQDERLDLSVRYRDYGWPATIILNEKGEEIVKRRGYIDPYPFLNLLEAVVADPSPEQEYRFSTTKVDDEAINDKIIKECFANLDFRNGGYDQSQKYVPKEPFDLCFVHDRRSSRNWIQTSLENAQGLIDPVWGGVYQYSTDGDWNHLHFEKLLDRQGRYIEMYSKAYLRTPNPEFLASAKKILYYADHMLNPKTGTWLRFNSQDADLIAGVHAESFFELNNEDRLARGIPRIDSNIYTGNNAKLARSLVWLAIATGDYDYVTKSLGMTQELLERQRISGLVNHNAEFSTNFYLEDQVEMLELLSTVYQVTGKTEFKLAMLELSEGMEAYFRNSNGQYQNFIGASPLAPSFPINLNLRLGTVFHQIALLTDNAQVESMAANLTQVLEESIPTMGYPALLYVLRKWKNGDNPIVIWGGTEVAPEDRGTWLNMLAKNNGKSLFKINEPDSYPELGNAGFYVCKDRACGPPNYGVQALGNLLN